MPTNGQIRKIGTVFVGSFVGSTTRQRLNCTLVVEDGKVFASCSRCAIVMERQTRISLLHYASNSCPILPPEIDSEDNDVHNENVAEHLYA